MREPDQSVKQVNARARRISAGIFAGLLSAASVTLGCRHRAVDVLLEEPVKPIPDPLPLGQVFILESGGGPPEDTALVVPPEGRIIVLRRGPPDNTLFAQLAIPTDSVTRRAAAKDSVARLKESAKAGVPKDVAKTAPADSLLKPAVPKIAAPAPAGARDSTGTKLALRPRPGIFGLDIDAGSRSPAGAALSFSYAVQFVAPEGARERYGSDLAFERELMIARIGSDSIVTFLLTKRTGSDFITAVIPGPGRYVVAAPR